MVRCCVVLSNSQRNTNQLPRWVKTMPLFYALMLAASYLWPKLKPALLTSSGLALCCKRL